MTVQQPPLFGDPPNDEAKLGENQQLVLNAIREHGRIEADEAGALICEKNGKHSRDQRCEWDARNGRQVLASLSRRGFKNGKRQKASGPGPGTEIPF